MKLFDLSTFLSDLSNESECLPSIQHNVPIRSQSELALMFLFWLALCSLWRHVVQYLFTNTAKQLAIKEYGESVMPKSVENLQDKNKMELLNEAPKLRNFKKLASLKVKEESINSQFAKKEKQSQKSYPTTYKEDLQKWMASLSTSGPKQFPLKKLSEETKLSEKEITEYWKYCYITMQKKELTEKYLEEMWKCLTVGLNSFFGCYVMWNQKSFWNSQLLWKQFPQMETPDMTLFYGLGIGYHLHRAVFQCLDHHRKDFLAMVLHHWTTVGLIWFSWHYGLTECGTIVMFCHDATDFLLAAGKVCAYHHFVNLKELIFALFVLHWIFIRMLLFAKKVVITATVDTVPSHSCHWAWYFFIPGLWVLLVLHFYWLSFICRVIFRKIFLNKSVVDNRSDSDTWQEE